MTIVGTRPELIRLSRTIDRLDEQVDHVLVHTGQNYDYELNEVFFSDLRLRAPDYYLDVNTCSLGHVMGETLIKSEQAMSRERPDALIVLGDTNSSIAAVMAKRLRVPVYHLEAGNRCFDENVPEEANRRLIDHVADYNLVYTEHARRNLIAEGVASQRILLTGSPMREVLRYFDADVQQSRVIEKLGLDEGAFILVSAHREENVDDSVRLDALLACLVAVRERFDLPILVSTHPRTRARLERRGVSDLLGIDFHRPFGFFDYVRLQMSAFCVLSDSGTISEESAILNFPAVSLRESIERPEAIDAASMITAGLNQETVLAAVESMTGSHRRQSARYKPCEYEIENFSERVVHFLISTTHSHHARFRVRREPW